MACLAHSQTNKYSISNFGQNTNSQSIVFYCNGSVVAYSNIQAKHERSPGYPPKVTGNAWKILKPKCNHVSSKITSIVIHRYRWHTHGIVKFLLRFWGNKSSTVQEVLQFLYTYTTSSFQKSEISQLITRLAPCIHSISIASVKIKSISAKFTYKAQLDSNSDFIKQQQRE